MAIIGRRLPIPKPIIVAAAFGSALMIFVGVWFSGADETGGRSVVSSLDLPLPARPADTGTSVAEILTTDDFSASPIDGVPVNPAFIEPALDPLKPIEPDLELVDASPLGPLPRIAADGRQPVATYARPYDRSDDRPKVAILVSGLGLQADATNATIHLPGAISLLFSPYTEDLPALFERARLAGHEVLIELPMEPADYPASDPGPHTLRASGTVDANIERLSWVLSRAPGFFAVAGQGGAFAQSAEAVPVMDALAARGIGMIEIDGNALLETSQAAGLTYLSATDWIDSTPTPEAIDQALADLEAKARQDGQALGVAEAYPVTLQRLVDWAGRLEEKGIALIPASALLLNEAGASDNPDQASNLAQSRN